MVAAVEMEPLGEATELVWMLALLFRLEPNPRLFKREVMTSTKMRRLSRRKSWRGLGTCSWGRLGRKEGNAKVQVCLSELPGAGAGAGWRSWRCLTHGAHTWRVP